MSIMVKFASFLVAVVIFSGTASAQGILIFETRDGTRIAANSAVTDATPTRDPVSLEHGVSVILSEQDTATFGNVTQANIGQPITLRVCGVAYGQAVVRAAIKSGRLVLTGELSETSATNLAKKLRENTCEL